MSIESQREFVDALHGMVNYWARLELKQGDGYDENGMLLSDQPIERQRLEGLVHSILCMMDGVSSGIDPEIIVDAIEGPSMLHELFCEQQRKRNNERRKKLAEQGIHPPQINCNDTTT